MLILIYCNMICFPLTYLSYKHMIMIACKWLFMNIKNFVPKMKAHRPIRPPEMKFKERSYIFGCPFYLIGISHSRMQQRNSHIPDYSCIRLFERFSFGIKGLTPSYCVFNFELQSFST